MFIAIGCYPRNKDYCSHQCKCIILECFSHLKSIFPDILTITEDRDPQVALLKSFIETAVSQIKDDNLCVLGMAFLPVETDNCAITLHHVLIFEIAFITTRAFHVANELPFNVSNVISSIIVIGNADIRRHCECLRTLP